MLLKQGQCSNSKQPLPAAELGFTLPPAWPSHWEQCDCWTRAQVWPYTQGLKALSLSISPSISITLIPSSSHFHINTSTHQTHNRGPAHHHWGAPDERKTESDSSKRSKKEGVSAERRKRTGVWVVVGGELLLRRGMIFFCYMFWAFTLLGHQTACKSSNSEPSIKWENFEKGTDEVTLAAKEWISLWVFYGKWRMWGVICGWEGSEHRLYFSWLFKGGVAAV